MRKLFLIFLILIFVSIIVIGVFLTQFDVNRYKPQIIQQMEKALNHHVDIDEIDLVFSIQQGVVVYVRGFAVSEFADVPTQNSLSARDMRLGVDVLSFLTRREIAIQSFKLSQGTFRYRAAPEDKPLILNITDVELTMNNFSLEGSFPFQLKAVIAGGAYLRLQGTAGIEQSKQTFSLHDADMTITISDLPSSELRTFDPKGVIKEISGKIYADIKDAIIIDGGLSRLSVEGNVTKGRLRLLDAKEAFDPITATFQLNESSFTLAQLSLALGRGRIGAKGRVVLKEKSPHLQFYVTMDSVDLTALIDQKNQPVKLNGLLFGEFEGEATDLHTEAIIGEGSFKIQEGRLKNINVLRLVLSKMSMIPGLLERVESNLPKGYKEKLNAKDTILQKAEFKAAIKGNTVMIEQAEVEADQFGVEGTGTLGFDQRLSLNTSIYIPKDLSLSMIAAVPEFQYVFEEDEQIRFPVYISGRVPDLQYSPDLEYLTKKLFQKTGRDELKKILKKAIGIEEKAAPQGEPQETQAPPKERPQGLEGIIGQILGVEKEKKPLPAPPPGEQTPPPEGTPPSQQEQKSIEEQLIEGVLDKIFK